MEKYNLFLSFFSLFLALQKIEEYVPPPGPPLSQAQKTFVLLIFVFADFIILG